METIDDECLEKAIDFMMRAKDAGEPFFVWFNATHMHFRTHAKPEELGQAGRWQSPYHDVMVSHSRLVGKLLKFLDDSGLVEDTVRGFFLNSFFFSSSFFFFFFSQLSRLLSRSTNLSRVSPFRPPPPLPKKQKPPQLVQYSTDNGPHANTWPDAGTTPFRGEKNSNWEGAFRVPCLVRYPPLFPAGTTLNGIFSHNDWFVTLSALMGMDDIADRLKAGAELDGKRYKVHLDGHNQLDYLSGKTDKSAREHFFYVNDDGDLVALRFSNWKFHFLENRCPGTLRVWAEPFTPLRVPKLYNLRTDPFEKVRAITERVFFSSGVCFFSSERRGQGREVEENFVFFSSLFFLPLLSIFLTKSTSTRPTLSPTRTTTG